MKILTGLVLLLSLMQQGSSDERRGNILGGFSGTHNLMGEQEKTYAFTVRMVV